MAIQNRRGNIANFDANKMLPGEFAYALDTAELFYCVAPGTVRRCATKEELEQILTSAPEAYSALQELIADLENETVLTGILEDISDLKLTKLAITGDSKMNTTTFLEAATLANIVTGETHATLFGKIKKFFSFVGTTTLTTTAQTVSAAANEILAANRSGWSTLLVTDKLTYKSASAPTFVCNTLNTSNVARDFRTYLSIGMKIKLTQDAVVKYFFVTEIDATSITLYGGTDYVLTTTAITNVCYSVVKSPHGFPMNPNKWSVSLIDNNEVPLSGQANTYRQFGKLQLMVPTGLWKFSADGILGSARTVVGFYNGAFVAFSKTIGNADNRKLMYAIYTDHVAPNETPVVMSLGFHVEDILDFSSATILYVIGANVSPSGNSATLSGNLKPTILTATCAYL